MAAETERKLIAVELTQVAIAMLAASAPGGLGMVIGAGAAIAASRWLDRVTSGWNHPGFAETVAESLAEEAARLGLDEAETRTAFAQAKAALADHGLSSEAFAALNFDAEAAAAAITANSQYYQLTDADGPARRLLVGLYAALPRDPASYRDLDFAFQRTALELLHDRDASLRQLAENLGWAALLYLPRPPHRRKPTPAMLLDPALDLVPYHERTDGTDADLDEWLHGADDIAIRIYGAAGGAGKTRFMLHHCRRLSARTNDSGWRLGFLSGEEAARQAPDAAYRALFATPGPVLVVVDYAEDRSGQLDKLFAAAQGAPDKCHIRMVLLTRRIGGHWWSSYLARAETAARNLLGEYPPETRDLAPLTLTPGKERTALFHEALDAFAPEL